MKTKTDKTIYPISKAALEKLVSPATVATRVKQVFSSALSPREDFLQVFERYAEWNGFFGSGVSALAGKIGRARKLFLDKEEPIRALSDRSVYVASFFFDAARDEFNDRSTPWRDTHRCLAQACLRGLVDFNGFNPANKATAQKLNQNFHHPAWLSALDKAVSKGYGVGQPDTLEGIFRAMGYHLGSELLADEEFSIIDGFCKSHPDLHTFLRNNEYTIDGHLQNAYRWISIHSGEGDAVEADHFAWSMRGIVYAFRFTPKAQAPKLKQSIIKGFLQFNKDHQEFFGKVMADISHSSMMPSKKTVKSVKTQAVKFKEVE